MARSRTPRSVIATAVLAGLVTVAALGTVVTLRQLRPGSDDPSNPASAASSAGCGSAACLVLASETVGNTTVELLAAPSGRVGRVRVAGQSSETVMDTTITSMGVTLSRRSLTCVDGPMPACLVSGTGTDGTVGEVFVSGAGDRGWRAGEQPYLSDVGYMTLADATDSTAPEIAVARYLCGSSASEEVCRRQPVYLQVFDLRGAELGCSPNYQRLANLPGWPDVRLREGRLRGCP